VTLLIVFLILVVLLRAIVAPLYLIASVVISFLSAMGMGVVFFQFVLHQAIYWNVQATAFIVLVAVGADYNLLLVTRNSSRVGLRHSLRHHSRGPFDRRCHHLGRHHLRRLDVRPVVRQPVHDGANRVHHRRRSAHRHIRGAHHYRAGPGGTGRAGKLVALQDNSGAERQPTSDPVVHWARGPG
jgi:hypothetical protein